MWRVTPLYELLNLAIAALVYIGVTMYTSIQWQMLHSLSSSFWVHWLKQTRSILPPTVPECVDYWYFGDSEETTSYGCLHMQDSSPLPCFGPVVTSFDSKYTQVHMNCPQDHLLCWIWAQFNDLCPSTVHIAYLKPFKLCFCNVCKCKSPSFSCSSSPLVPYVTYWLMLYNPIDKSEVEYKFGIQPTFPVRFSDDMPTSRHNIIVYISASPMSAVYR